ncbi:hypothetical protein Q0M94_02110 [Deinococcus radiomollis]|uniref:hypothetical protein n=1 Tax=Deinococcus radiomollis TaxID=468916 RepID=UPI0038925729
MCGENGIHTHATEEEQAAFKVALAERGIAYAEPVRNTCHGLMCHADDGQALRTIKLTANQLNGTTQGYGFERRELIPGLANSGNYFYELWGSLPIGSFDVEVPAGIAGTLTVKICQVAE